MSLAAGAVRRSQPNMGHLGTAQDVLVLRFCFQNETQCPSSRHFQNGGGRFHIRRLTSHERFPVVPSKGTSLSTLDKVPVAASVATKS